MKLLSLKLKKLIPEILTSQSGDIYTKIREIKNDYEGYDHKFLYVVEEILKGPHNSDYTEIPFKHIEKIVDGEVLLELQWIVGLNTDIAIKAKIYDCIWIYRNDYKFALKAYELYTYVIEKNFDFKKNYYFLNRCISIALHLGESNISRDNLKKYIYILWEQGKDDTTYCSLKLLTVYFEKELLRIDEIINMCVEKIDILEDGHEINLIEEYLNLIEKLFLKKEKLKDISKSESKSEIKRINRKRADFYINFIEKYSRNSIISIKYIKKAINALKRIKGTEDERKRLLNMLDKIQRETIKGLHVSSHSTDITEFVKSMQSDIDKLDMKEAIFYLLFHFPYESRKEIEVQVIEDSEKYFLSSFFNKVLVDKRGKTIANIPAINTNNPYEDLASLRANAEHSVKIRYQLVADGFIKNVLSYINEKFDIDESYIDEIIENSVFVPKKRRNAFFTGIKHGLKYDLISALSVLIPQVEYAVRCMAEELGDIVYKINEEGIEEALSFDSILDLPNINECLDEDIMFNLKTIFTSKFGLNMRNIISHGFYEDTEFFSMDALYTWWFIFKICYMFSYDTYDNIIISVIQKLEIENNNSN